MFCHIPLVFRKVSAASREELEHHVPAAQQDLTQEENAAQRDGVLQPEAFGGSGSVFLYHQVPGHCRELHGVDAEDIQRAAAHRLNEVGDWVVQQPLYFHKQDDETEAHNAVQQDADRAHGPLAQGDAVRFASQQYTQGDAQRRCQQAQDGQRPELFLKQALFLGQKPDVQVRQNGASHTREMPQPSSMVPSTAHFM